MVRKLLLVATGLSTALLIAPAAQANITGTVDASIVLNAGCIINGQLYNNGSTGVDLGDLDFGTNNTLFQTADAQILSGAAGFTLQCSNGVAPIVRFQAGAHDGSGTGSGIHAMAHSAAAGQFVRYNLYSDPARTLLISNGDAITLLANGASQVVNVYGRAFGTGGLVVGTYTDVLTIVVEI